MHQAIKDLFDRYESQTNAALAGQPDMAAVTDLYDQAFIAASPAGVIAGQKDREFRDALAAGFARNRELGATRVEIRDLRVMPIDPIHALAHVDWRAVYDTADGQKQIDFTNTYLTRTDGDATRVFGWITGDENQALREHGII